MRTALALLEKGGQKKNGAIPERKTYSVALDKHTQKNPNILIYFNSKLIDVMQKQRET